MKNLLKALAEFHKRITCVPKTEDNPFHHSKYSGLDTVYNHIKKDLLECGIWFYHKSSKIENDEGIEGIEIRTILYHIDSGEQLDCTPVNLFPKEPQNAQAMGSCITYGKRYSLQLALGLPSEEEDDDANIATGVKPAKIEKEPSKTYTIKAEEKEKNKIPFWMEMEIKKINSIERLEEFYKQNEASARKYMNIEDLIEQCKKRKEEIISSIPEPQKEPEKPKKKKINIPEKELSRPNRSELINLLKYYAEKIYGKDINILDLFMDEEGVVPSSIDKISDNELIEMIERLKENE